MSGKASTGNSKTINTTVQQSPSNIRMFTAIQALKQKLIQLIEIADKELAK